MKFFAVALMRQISERMNHPIPEFAIFVIGSSQEEGGRRVRGVGARRVSRSRFSLQVGRGKGGGEASDAEQAPRGRRICAFAT